MRKCNCCGHWLEYGFGIYDGEDWYCEEDCLLSGDSKAYEYIEY